MEQQGHNVPTRDNRCLWRRNPARSSVKSQSTDRKVLAIGKS